MPAVVHAVPEREAGRHPHTFTCTAPPARLVQAGRFYGLSTPTSSGQVHVRVVSSAEKTIRFLHSALSINLWLYFYIRCNYPGLAWEAVRTTACMYLFASPAPRWCRRLDFVLPNVCLPLSARSVDLQADRVTRQLRTS
jgi:hypothetical protein